MLSATVRYTTALALREACARDLGSDEARLAVATALTNLATTLHAVGDDKAVQLLRRSCAIKFEVLETTRASPRRCCAWPRLWP